MQRSIAAVVVNYNYGRFVGEAIDSVLAQSDPFDEIFVVDDGSTDDSMEVIDGYRDRVTVIEKENGGPLSAALTAVAAVESDYFYLLDADDIAEPDLVATVRAHLAGDPIKLQFQLRSIDPDGAPIDSVFPSYAPGYSTAQMIDDNERLGFYVCAPTSANVFRASYLAHLATFDLDGREAYDGVPAQLAPYFGEVVSVNTVIAQYRVHDTGISQWGAPTPALMKREVQRFTHRWEQGIRVLARSDKALPDPWSSAFITERDLMGAVLEGRRPSPALAWRYAKSLLRSGRSLPQRVLFSLWGFVLTVVPKRVALDLVVSRRSARGRGKLVSAIARISRAKEKVAA